MGLAPLPGAENDPELRSLWVSWLVSRLKQGVKIIYTERAERRDARIEVELAEYASRDEYDDLTSADIVGGSSTGWQKMPLVLAPGWEEKKEKKYAGYSKHDLEFDRWSYHLDCSDGFTQDEDDEDEDEDDKAGCSISLQSYLSPGSLGCNGWFEGTYRPGARLDTLAEAIGWLVDLESGRWDPWGPDD